MKSLSSYIQESLPLDKAKEYVGIKRDIKAQKYMEAFWDELGKYAQEHGGYISRNEYRIYLPYTGRMLKPDVDWVNDAGSPNYNSRYRVKIRDAVASVLDKRGQWMDNWDYIAGTCDVGMKDQSGNIKVRKNQKIGKLLTGHDDLLKFFANDLIRLSKGIMSAIETNRLWIVISNHTYDIAGMSTNREWTSCMNIYGGQFKGSVKEDIKYGTLVAYIIDKNDTNIEHPYGRVLIKPYKLRRPGYVGFLSCPIIYSPEVTVYSPYVGMRPVREWLKNICEETQTGNGMLISLKQLYSDTYHDDADPVFHGKKQ